MMSRKSAAEKTSGREFRSIRRLVFPRLVGTSVLQEEPLRSCITHFSWPDSGLCEVPSKPTLAKA